MRSRMPSLRMMGARKEAVVAVILIKFVLVMGLVSGSSSSIVGINYGRLGDNLPPPAKVVQLIQNLKIGSAKIFDHDPTVIAAFANSSIELIISVTNQEFMGVAQSQDVANAWVLQNVVAFYPATNISTVLVGNELLSSSTPEGINGWNNLTPAIFNIYMALKSHNLHRNIKVSTSVAYDALNVSYPPSAGSFRQELVAPVLLPLLKFLNWSDSAFMINVYPFFAFTSNPADVPFDYATFGSSVPVSDGQFQYTNLLDAQLDALHFAMAKLGYAGVKIAISETGWPSKGDANEPGAIIPNAALFNRRLVSKMIAAGGTPAMPGVTIPTFIFALFNEDLKTGATSERNWGLLYPDGTPVYSIDLTGQTPDSGYAPLSVNTSQAPSSAPPARESAAPPFQAPQTSPPTAPAPTVPPPLQVAPPPLQVAPPPPLQVSPPPASSTGTLPLVWCTANPNAGVALIQAGLDYACGQGKADCAPIQVGQACFDPNTVQAHASWAFNSYWQQTRAFGGSCNFNGAAIQTTIDPSQNAGCVFPGN